MDVIYGLIPSMIIIGIVLVIVLFWAIKSGQFDDFEGEAHRILMDEDLTPTTHLEENKMQEQEKNSENLQKKQDKSTNSD